LTRIPSIIDNLIDDLFDHVKSYRRTFDVYTSINQPMAYHYAVNLMRCQNDHTNMERMVGPGNEEVTCHQYHQFLSESKWDYAELNNKTAFHANNLMRKCKGKSGKPTGAIIDESGHLKKGKMSVGVGRQYAGVVGKVDNCQVAVYLSLGNQDTTTLIDSALFLPKDWTDDERRCEKAGIPKEHRSFKTKPQLALELMKAKVKLGVEFDWIGGDGSYGHNSELSNGLDDQGLFHVLDCHKSEPVFMSEPSLSIPEKKRKKGRKPTAVKPNVEATKLAEYYQSLVPSDWKEVTIRKTAKGWKRSMFIFAKYGTSTV
jgi:SRSO17 transposase